MNETLLQLSIWIPLLCALLLALGLGPRLSVPVAAAGFLVPAAAALLLWARFPAGAGAAPLFCSAVPTGLEMLGIGMRFGLNGVSMPLFVMAGVVGLAAGLHAMQSGVERLPLYLCLLLVMQGGLMGLFASTDLVFFFFFHEVALIPVFIMVGVWGGRERGYAAMKMAVYLTAGAMIALAGLLLLHVSGGGGSFDAAVLRRALAEAPPDPASQGRVYGLLLLGFGILVSLWPLHTWAPLGYGAAPTSAAMLHAGVLKKFGLYGLVQFAIPMLPLGAASWSRPLAWLALGNVLVVGLITLSQRDLKQMIGYSSVMHMGCCFLGLATLKVAGAGGVVLLMVGHGFSVALLFLLAGAIQRRTHTHELDRMGGLARQAPVLAAFFAAAVFASAGLPGFLNFWGELAVLVSLWPFSKWAAVAVLAGLVISAVYGLRAAARVFYGTPAPVPAGAAVADLSWPERIPALLLLAMLLVLGFRPGLIAGPVDAALNGLLSGAACLAGAIP